MKYGNCLIGVIALAIKYKFYGKVIVLWQSSCRIPHLAWLTPDNKIHEYTTVKDILPPPFYWIIFRGKFRTRNFSQIKNSK